MTGQSGAQSSPNRQLLRRLALYFVGNMSAKLLSMVLTRLQTALLSTSDFGQASMTLNAMPLLTSFCFMEIWSAVLAFIYREKAPEDQRKVITNGLCVALMALPVFVVLGTGLGFVSGQQFIPYILIYGLVYLLDQLYQFTARGLGLNRLFALIGILSTFVLGVTQILSLAVFKLGDRSLLISHIAASATAVLVYEHRLKQRHYLKRRYLDRALMRSMAQFALPLSINAMAFFALSVLNQFLIAWLASTSDVGLYNAAGRISSIVNLLVTVFSLAWQETAFSMQAEEGRAVYYTETLSAYIRLITGALFVAIPISGLVFPWLVDETFAASAELIPLTLVFAAMNALNNYAGHVLTAESLNRPLTLTTMLGAALNVLVLWIAYPWLGLHAGYLALSLGFAFSFLARLTLAVRHQALSVPRKELLILGVAIPISVGLYYLQRSAIYYLSMSVGMMLLASVVLWPLLKPIWIRLRKKG